MRKSKGRKETRKPFFSSVRLIVQNKNLLICYLLTFIMLMSFTAYYDGFHREFGETASNEALFWSKACALAGTLFSFISVKWILKYGKQTTIRYAMLGIITSFLLAFLSYNLYLATGLSLLFANQFPFAFQQSFP